MIFFIVCLLLIVVLVIVLSWVWPPDSPWAPWWSIKDREIRKALKLAKVTKDDIIYDLGSGTGRLLIVGAKEFGARGVGIEIDPLRVIYSDLMIRINRVNDKVTIRRKSFFEEDISAATVVFAYLVPKTLNLLVPKFKKELKPETRIISYRYKMDLPIVKESKDSKLRLYKI